MKKILFIYEFVDLGYEVIEQAGVECLSSYMKYNGWSVDIINIAYEGDIIKNVLDFKPDIIGFSVTTPNILKVLNLAADIKKSYKNVNMVVGGVGASIEPEFIVEEYSFIDAVMIGEGEESLLEVSDSLYQNTDISNIDGLCFMKDGRAYRTKGRKLIPDLDVLPEPMHIGYEKYKDNRNLKYIALSTTRGCYGNCSFCARNFKNQEGSIIRNRSAEKVIEEIEHCIEKYDIHRFAFLDQTFEDARPVGKERIERIADLIIEKNLNIIFTVHIRSENWKESDLPLIYKLREAGLVGIYPGVESVDEETLKIYNKYARKEDHERTLKLFQKTDVALDIGFIMFNPYTSIEKLEENRKFIKKMGIGHLAHIYFNQLILFPGVDIVERMRKDNLLLMEPSYHNFYEAQYAYKFVDDRINYIFKHVFTEENMNKLRVHDLYIFSINWENYISIVKLKLDNNFYKELIEETEIEFKNMREYFNEVLDTFFVNILLVGKNKDVSLLQMPDYEDQITKYKHIFETNKMKLFRRVIKNNEDLCTKFYNY